MLVTILSVLIIGAAASPVVQRQSTVPVGTIISSCTVSGVFALTFDDGPFMYTEQVLDTLAANNVKATFFLNGMNYGNIYDYTSTVQRMVAEGHQVGSHTYDHKDLPTLDDDAMKLEMTQLETAFSTILGKIPTYMRPPSFATNADVLSVMAGLGYHVIQADVDTKDWQNETPETIGISGDLFEQGLAAGGTISLEHDVHPTTVDILLPRIISDIQAKGLSFVTVGDCLGDPEANWYR